MLEIYNPNTYEVRTVELHMNRWVNLEHRRHQPSPTRESKFLLMGESLFTHGNYIPDVMTVMKLIGKSLVIDVEAKKITTSLYFYIDSQPSSHISLNQNPCHIFIKFPESSFILII